MTAGLGRRARNLEEVGINFHALMGFAPKHYRPLEPRPTDVFISPWAKSGTTMTQQMFHQMRMIAATGASDMDFDDISRMTPWEDAGPIADFDMNMAQRAEPRGGIAPVTGHSDFASLAAELDARA